MSSPTHNANPERDKRYPIAEIELSDLFGKYSYRVSPLDRKEAKSGAPPLMLLYGPNGCGKTTVLRILWDLLSPAERGGHRSRLARTPFRRVSVRLGTGDTITLEKPDSLVGGYTISVSRGKRQLVSLQYSFDKHAAAVHAMRSSERVGRGDTEQSQIASLSEWPSEDLLNAAVQDALVEYTFKNAPDEYVAYLREHGSRPIFLADDRRIHVDSEILSAREKHLRRGRERDDEPSLITTELAAAIHRTNDWLRQQIFSGAAAGSKSADDIYREVLNHIAEIDDLVEEADIDSLRQRLHKIDERTKRFSEFGLVPHINARPLLRVLDRVHPTRHGLVSSILDPYLNGQLARLDSLQDAESLVRSFVSNINGYLDDKALHFSPRRGLEIHADDDHVLDTSKLSSGERQLLLLHCNALLARPSASLFLIDEPELSLNAQWQRRLVQTLLDCVGSSGVQFIMATHSIEILTKHRQYLTQLREE